MEMALPFVIYVWNNDLQDAHILNVGILVNIKFESCNPWWDFSLVWKAPSSGFAYYAVFDLGPQVWMCLVVCMNPSSLNYSIKNGPHLQWPVKYWTNSKQLRKAHNWCIVHLMSICIVKLLKTKSSQWSPSCQGSEQTVSKTEEHIGEGSSEDDPNMWLNYASQGVCKYSEFRLHHNSTALMTQCITDMATIT